MLIVSFVKIVNLLKMVKPLGYLKKVTGDIVQGLPRIEEEILEARKKKFNGETNSNKPKKKKSS
jgi:hypothetical protein